jgi:hypothetical protein
MIYTLIMKTSRDESDEINVKVPSELHIARHEIPA